MNKGIRDLMHGFLVARLDELDVEELYQQLIAGSHKVDLNSLLTELVSTGRYLDNDDHDMLNKARVLIKHGADLDTQGYDGETLLMLAARRHDTLMATFLIAERSNLDIHDDHGQNILHVACNAFLVDLVSLCLARGMNPNAPDAAGQTALKIVFCPSQPEYADNLLSLTEMLLSYGASVTACDREGMTVLHFVARDPFVVPQGDYEKLTRLLLESGADPFAVAVDGITPWMLAIAKHNEAFLTVVTEVARKANPTLFSSKSQADVLSITTTILT